MVNSVVKWLIKYQIGSIKLQDVGWKERVVVRESQLKYLQLLFTSTNDMLNNHLSNLIRQNLKRLFADLHISKVIVLHINQAQVLLFGSSFPRQAFSCQYLSKLISLPA